MSERKALSAGKPIDQGELMDALAADHEYLTAGGVFSPEMIETYIATRRLADVDAVRLRPHPHEFVMYYGV